MFNGNKDIWCRQFLMEIKIFDVDTINTHTIEYIVRFFLLWLYMWSFPGTWNSPQTVTTQLLNRASDNLIFKTQIHVFCAIDQYIDCTQKKKFIIFFLGLYFYPFVHLIDALDTYNIVLTCLEVPMCHPLLLQPATSGVTIAYVWLIAPQYHSFNRCLKSRQFFPFHST